MAERKLPDAQPPSLTNLIQQATATSSPSPDLRAEFIHRASWKAGVLGALNVLVVVTAIRLITLIAVVGGIVLTAFALSAPDAYKLGALAIYAVAVVVPVIWMASRR